MSCNEFEKLFIMEDESSLLEHIKTCSDCAEEYKEMEFVSNLVKEVRPLYKKTKYRVAMTMAASILLLCFLGVSLSIVIPEYNYRISMNSEIYPIDEYGLLELY